MDVLQSLTVALLVVAGLGGTLVVLQKRGWARVSGFSALSRGRPRRMEAVERIALSPGISLHLVRVDGKMMLVSSGPGGCSMKVLGEES